MHTRLSVMTRALIQRRLIPALLITALLAATAWPAMAGKGNADNPRILPPQSKPFGKSYGEWSAEHWKWVFSMPADQHPMSETADCDAGQSGPVWFLGGTMAATLENGVWVGKAHRECRIPAGKAIFFPILDSEASLLENTGQETEAELRAIAEWGMNFASGMSCEIDGVPVKNLDQYRVQSSLFTFGPLPENNWLQNWGYTAPAGSITESVSDGIFLMLAPLPVGKHTIHFAGSIIIPEWNYSFVLDVIYVLTVTPPNK